VSDKEDHEDSALRALRDELIARGRQAEITAHPDRDPAHPLTVDAIFRIDGTEWAVDHCLLSRPHDLPPAMSEAERKLKSRLDSVAQAHQCGLMVSYLPQARSKHTQADADDYYDAIVKLADHAASSGEFAGGDDGFTTAQPFRSSVPEVQLAPFTDTTGSPFLGTQIEEGIREPLTKKLTRQLRNAKDQGYPVALLLDQLPRAGGNSKTVWLASPAGIAKIVQGIVNKHPGVADQVWLRPAFTAKVYVAPQIHLLIA
jgi:hypothetical protein